MDDIVQLHGRPHGRQHHAVGIDEPQVAHQAHRIGERQYALRERVVAGNLAKWAADLTGKPWLGAPEWVVDPEAKRLLLTHYKEADLNTARLRMAHVPEGATLIDNPVSLAPGFQVRPIERLMWNVRLVMF